MRQSRKNTVWRILKADYLVIGNARLSADGGVAVDFELYDVISERLMISQRYSIPREQWRDAAHKIPDAG